MEEKAPKTISRRGFINYLVSAGGVALWGAIIYPMVRYLIPPEVPEATSSSVVAGNLEELPPNSGKIFRFGDKAGILIRTPTGEFKAFSATCTHLSCTVQYRSDASHIWCACHNGHYDLNGKNISGPPPRPLEEYSVFVKGNEIVVSKKLV